mmetsp:Transcript_25701/g.22719  ORF Transcript_25701/g.22719 Transcript_25701/m.22719 type:complete len:143 (-) Transcript_25701:498-926(-)
MGNQCDGYSGCGDWDGEEFYGGGDANETTERRDYNAAQSSLQASDFKKYNPQVKKKTIKEHGPDDKRAEIVDVLSPSASQKSNDPVVEKFGEFKFDDSEKDPAEDNANDETKDKDGTSKDGEEKPAFLPAYKIKDENIVYKG